MAKKTGVFIGRFQPFHQAHSKCIEKILETHARCLVLVRDTEVSAKNPFTFGQRSQMIRAAFPNEQRVEIMRLPDPGADLTVHIGREVGYALIQLDEATENISATDIRARLYAKKPSR